MTNLGGAESQYYADVDPAGRPANRALVSPSELMAVKGMTGEIYRALAPVKQVYKPTEWNRYHIELRGSRIVVILNGEKVQDADLSAYAEPVKRHDGTDASGLKDRPRRGHIGFQDLSRGGDHVIIRNARIQVLDVPSQR